MRLPVSKVYRAFPELDRFEDVRCEAYVRTVRRSQGGIGLLVSLSHVLVGIVTALAMMFATGIAAAALDPPRGPRGDMTFVVLFVGVSVVAPAIGTILGFYLRDRRLRRLLVRQIESSRCPECSYLLLGLVPSNGAIRCPECGTAYTLQELGLSREQLLVDAEDVNTHASGTVRPT